MAEVEKEPIPKSIKTEKPSDSPKTEVKSSSKKWWLCLGCCIGLFILAIIIFIIFIFIRFSSSRSNDVDISKFLPKDTASPNTNSNSTPTSPKGDSSSEQPPVSSDSQPESTNQNAAPSEAGISKQAQIDYFIKVAITDEDKGNAASPLRKWAKGNVTIQIIGQSNSSADQCIDDTISTINSLSSTMKLSRTNGDGDIQLHLTDRATLEARGFETGGFFIFDQPAGGNYNLEDVGAYAATDYWPGEDVPNCHIIRHELTHSIGLPFNASGYDYSVFNVPSTTTCDYQEIDKQMIKMLYNTGIRSGLNEAEVRAFLASASW